MPIDPAVLVDIELLESSAQLRHRELALRAGVNMVMYALTGNYKTDQVHLPSIIERLTN